MAKCEYSFYDSGDRCRIKGKLKGESTDKVGSDTYRNFCTYSDGHKKCPFYEAHQKESNGSGGFYLTSACVESQGLPDDCNELQTLRRFRDEWLSAQPYGKEDITEYYQIAPRIVTEISRRPDGTYIYSKIYSEVIVPCVEKIQSGLNIEAYNIYKNSVIKKFCEQLKIQFCN